MAFVLAPDGPADTDPDRYLSMSVTRNAAATVPEERRAREVRPGHTLRTDDIAGARPRSLPPFQRNNYHDNADIEGARPKPLHYQRHNKPDFTTTNKDIAGT